MTVSCALHPATFWRRVLLSKIRSWQLRRRELPASLHALAASATIVHDAEGALRYLLCGLDVTARGGRQTVRRRVSTATAAKRSAR